MKLSIFCDLRHIGWVITENNTVINKGIKRVDVDFDSYYEFIAGLPVSKRISRREKRTARRNRWRRQSRRKNLVKYLSKAGFLSDQTYEYNLRGMLQLRVRALTEKLQQHELCAVFLSLQKKRGYKNMRGLANSKKSKNRKKIITGGNFAASS